MLTVGYGNGIHFRPDNGQLPSFDNTMVCDENFHNHANQNDYRQKYYPGDTVKIQVMITTGETPQMTRANELGVSVAVTGALVNSYTDYDFWEFTDTVYATADIGHLYQYTVRNSTTPTDDDWISEPVEVVEDLGELLLIEWSGNTTQYGCDYQGAVPIGGDPFVPFIRIEATFKDYLPKTEITVYGNQEEVVKLYERISRQIEFKSEAFPRYLIEKLVVASAHDYFYVNEVQFVREDKPDITNHEGGNLAEIKMILTQAEVLGLNTHDIGFDCDSLMADCKVTNLQETAVGANTTFTIPDEHGLDIITIWRNAGTDILLKFGTTVGGSEIAEARPSAANPNITLNVPQDLAKTGTATLYVTVSGTAVSVDIYVRTIKNRNS